MNARVTWHELPAGLRAQIEASAGAFVAQEQIGTGHNCLVGMRLRTESGEVFLKGVRGDHARAVWTQANEAMINPSVERIAPRLLFHVRTDGWDVLGFAYLTGYRHADLRPRSPDLPQVARALHMLSAVTSPVDLNLRTIEDRWRDYAGEGADLLAGSVVAHTDLHRHNIMAAAGDVRLIDWAWPTRAAAWVDTACVGLQLICAGHTPAAAEQWCRTVPAYAAADAVAVSTFVAAAQAMWQEISRDDPRAWKRDVAAAADRWLSSRLAERGT